MKINPRVFGYFTAPKKYPPSGFLLLLPKSALYTICCR